MTAMASVHETIVHMHRAADRDKFFNPFRVTDL